MWYIALRLLIGVVLIVHGFAHWHIPTSWKAGTVARSGVLVGAGLAQPIVNALSTLLWVLALVGFVLAGFGLLASQSWWYPLAAAAAVVSLLTIGLFWKPNFVIGALVDTAVLLLPLAVRWPITAVL